MNERLSEKIVYAMIRSGGMSEEEFAEWASEVWDAGYGCGANACNS